MRVTTTEQDVDQRNRLVVAHVGLVKVLAARLARRLPAQVEVGELVSVGMIGLVDAARRFRPSLGVPFDAFARRRVHGAMLDSLRGLDWAPRSVRKMRRDLDGAIARLRQGSAREPSDDEIAGELKMSPSEYRRMLDHVRSLDVASVRERKTWREQGQWLDLAVDPDEGPQARLERAELRGHLARAIQSLSQRERQILAMYYEHEMTLAEIGAVIGVGESRVSQLRTQAIARLRTCLRETLQLAEIP